MMDKAVFTADQLQAQNLFIGTHHLKSHICLTLVKMLQIIFAFILQQLIHFILQLYILAGKNREGCFTAGNYHFAYQQCSCRKILAVIYGIILRRRRKRHNGQCKLFPFLSLLVLLPDSAHICQSLLFLQQLLTAKQFICAVIIYIVCYERM